MAQPWWQIDWIWITTGWTLGAAGAGLLLWALFWNRSRGRKRCPKCWYDMAGTLPVERLGKPAWLCPECGKVSKSERRLLKTRRRWRWATLAMLLMLAGSGALVYRAVHADPWSHVSTRMLTELLPIGGYDGPFGRELMNRLGQIGPRSWNAQPSASSQELVQVALALPKGTFFARPLSERWQASYGRVMEESAISRYQLLGRSSFSQRTAKDQAAIDAAVRTWYDLAPLVSIRTRPRWPEGMPVWVEIDWTAYWPWPTPLHVGVRRAGTLGEFRSIWPVNGFPARPPNTPDEAMSFELKLSQYRQADRSADGTTPPEIDLGTRIFDIKSHIGGAVDDIIKPVASKKLDDLLASTLRYSIGDGWVNFNREGMTAPETKGLAFGVIVEFYLDGELVARERHWWSTDPPKVKGAQRGSEWLPVDPPPSHQVNPWTAQRGENWSLVMKSDPEAALRILDADRYWQGEVPLKFDNQTTKPRNPSPSEGK